jgi:hypothetical protein
MNASPPPPGPVPNVGPRIPVGPQPLPQPPGSVVVAPDADLNALTSSHPEGTTFWLLAGVHAQQNVTPKNNNRYVGQLGAVMDGQNAANHAFSGPAGGVTVENLVVKNYTAPAQDAPVNSRSGSGGWLIKNNEIAYNAGGAIEFGNDRIIANNLHHNLQQGYAGGGNNSVFTDNEIAYNNYMDLYSESWEAGGGKFWRTTNLVCSHNHSHHNHGIGLWDDSENNNITYSYNLCEHNWAIGIFHEIGYNAKIFGNVCRNNGTQTQYNKGPWPPWITQILIAASGGINGGLVEIYDNWITTSYNATGPDGLTPSYGSAITIVEQDRGNGTNGLPYLCRNIYVHDNTVDLSNGGIFGAVSDYGDVAMFHDNIKFANNHYTATGPNTFWWNNGTGNLAWWRSQGQD